MRILITSVGTATSVNLIKYFKRMGDYVLGVDINPLGYTAGSILSDEFIQVPFAIDEDYICVMSRIISEKRIDVLIPINDNEVYVFAKNKSKLACNCIIPSVETIDILRDKYVCGQYVKEMGVNVPDVLCVDDVSVNRVLRDRVGVGSKGVAFYDKGLSVPCYNYEEKFLQRKIDGIEYTVDVLADVCGSPIYIIPRKRIEVKNGVATKVKVENKTNLISVVKTITNNVVLPAFSNFQFIEDKNGDLWFIEINYRFSGCGSASLITTNDYLACFKEVIKSKTVNIPLNHDVRWDTIVTRYYEEVIYEEGIH